MVCKGLSAGMRNFLPLVMTIVMFLFICGPVGAAQQVVVTGKTVNIRAGPGTSHAVVTKASQGSSFALLGNSGDWYKVKLSSGQTGWVAGWLAKVQNTGQTSTGTKVNTASPPASAGVSTGTTQTAVVTGTTLNVRSGPGTSNGVVAQVKKGDRLDVITKSGDWLKVKVPSGKTGWVAGWLVKVESVKTTSAQGRQVPQSSQVAPPVSTGNDSQAVVNGSMVNIRSGPGTSYQVVKQAAQGDRFTLLGQSNDWYKVQLPGGASGWIVGWLVKVEKMEKQPQQPGDAVVPPAGSNQTPSRSGSHEVPAEQEKPGEQQQENPQQDSDANTSNSITLLSVDYEEKDEVTRVTLKADGEIKADIFKLNNPDRLVLDVQGARPGKLSETYNYNTEAVEQLRVGWFGRDPDVTRLAFNLKAKASYKKTMSDDLKILTLEIFIPRPGKGLSGRTIAVDPGHGGSDPGAVGSSGLREKDVNLRVARRVADLLADKGVNVVMTRSDDTYVDLYERTRIANEAGADVFVSIHMNANLSSSYSGTSTYYQSIAVSGDEWRMDASGKLAQRLQSNLLSSLGRRNIGVLQANFAVLRTAQMPAALAEVAFISNPQEESLMKGDSFTEQAAQAIVQGISDYFDAGI